MSGNGWHRQEQAIAALSQSSSITEASQLSGVSTRSFTRWLKNEEFKGRLNQARTALIDSAVNALRLSSRQMVEVLKQIALDGCMPPPSRVQAARAIIALAIEAGDIAQLREELRQLETRTINAGPPAWGE